MLPQLVRRTNLVVFDERTTLSVEPCSVFELTVVRSSQTGKNSPRTSKTDSPVVRSDECKFCVKKNIIIQLFMRLQQQIHTLLESWIPSRKQPFCLCWCTCSVVHDGKDLSIFVWSTAVNAVSVKLSWVTMDPSAEACLWTEALHTKLLLLSSLINKFEFGLSIRNLSLT